MKAQSLNDLPESCIDIKLGPHISHASDSMNGIINKNKNKNVGKVGAGEPRGEVGESANIKGTNVPKRHFTLRISEQAQPSWLSS